MGMTPLPPLTRNVWKDLIDGKYDDQITSFALKVLLKRVRNKMARGDASSSVMMELASELRRFFEEQGTLPNVKNDMRVIFKENQT
jgi:hypothetical protein